MSLQSKPSSYQVSKWLWHRALLTPIELSNLFLFIAPFQLYKVGGVYENKTIGVSQEEFVNSYSNYFSSLFNNTTHNLPTILLSNLEGSVKYFEVSEGKFLTKPYLPVIQVRAHSFMKTHDHRIQSMTHSSNSIRFGLEFAYPQLFVDPRSNKVVEIRKEEDYTNTKVFQKIGKWMRENTKPTPLSIEGIRFNATFRIGVEAVKLCKSHVDLKKENLSLWESQ